MPVDETLPPTFEAPGSSPVPDDPDRDAPDDPRSPLLGGPGTAEDIGNDGGGQNTSVVLPYEAEKILPVDEIPRREYHIAHGLFSALRRHKRT